MHNAVAVSLRILRQFKHDPRTLFMMIVAPVLALFILNIIFGAPEYEPLVLTVDMSEEFSSALEDADARVEEVAFDEGMQRLEDVDADAMVLEENGEMVIYAEGSDPSKTGAVVRAVVTAVRETAPLFRLDDAPSLPSGQQIDLEQLMRFIDVTPPAEPEIIYVHGAEDMAGFDFYGPVFIGTFVFFYVFITSGISFVRERTGGTLERVMATPIRRWEVVLGYVQGFGLFALVQTAIVAWASIYWVGFPNLGDFWLVLLIALSMALVSLSLGILVSEFANSELQVMQLMQIIVIPQILLSGMFDLSQTPQLMQTLSRLTPLTYGSDAMRSVMLRGADFGAIAGDLGVLWGFLAVFFVMNIFALKKYRRI